MGISAPPVHRVREQVSFKTAAVLASESDLREGPEALTVSELCERLRDVVRAQPQPVLVRGEVRDVSRAPSGHAYFSLRDDRAQLSCVLFRNDADASPATPLRDGVSILVRADLDFYPGRGQAQLLVRAIRPYGLGESWRVFELTRSVLAREGLLDAARKRPLPRFPRRIGLVTSEAGAALHDVLHVLRRRFPIAKVVLAPAMVQGASAPASLVQAIDQLNDRGVDVILVVRGGGSSEDLWAFNDEGLARAIAGSRVPVVGAVGHETDVTIAGMAADVRAPTPSAAAELAVPDKEVIEQSLESMRHAFIQDISRKLRDAQQRTDGFGAALTPGLLAAKLDAVRHQLTAARTGLAEVHRVLRLHRQTLDAIAGQLETLGPFSTLRRGYAIALKGERTLASVTSVAAGDALLLMLQDGDVECRVMRTKQR